MPERFRQLRERARWAAKRRPAWLAVTAARVGGVGFVACWSIA